MNDYLVRASGDLGIADGEHPTLHGHFAVWNRWTKIDSRTEGTFMERIAPGSMAESFAARTPKVLFHHGRDPEVGDKVLGIPSRLEEDEV